MLTTVKIPTRLCDTVRTHCDILLDDIFIPNYTATATRVALDASYCVSNRYDCDVPFDCMCLIEARRNECFSDAGDENESVHPIHGLRCGIGGIHPALPEPDEKEKLFAHVSDVNRVDEDADPFLVFTCMKLSSLMLSFSNFFAFSLIFSGFAPSFIKRYSRTFSSVFIIFPSFFLSIQ